MNDSQEKALLAAKELMITKGKDGVRMQEIADHAGVNKGLLHYYFKSKDNIFKEVFLKEFRNVYVDLHAILESNDPLDSKLEQVVDRYYDKMMANPKLPTFVMFEVNKNPDLVKELAERSELKKTVELLDLEFKKNNMFSSPFYAFQVILNIISMCAFPFMMRPMIEEVSQGFGKDWHTIMEERRTFLKSVVVNSFRP
jgi:TetR/AcrR family transcriptional regulator